MKYLLALMLVLIPSTIYGAGSSNNRNFIINRPINEVMEALQQPDQLMKLLNLPNVEVLDLTLKEVELDAQTILGNNKKDLTYSGKLAVSGHIRVKTRQAGTLELWLEGYAKRTNNSLTIQVYTTRTRGQVRHLNCWAVISKRTESTTLVQLHATMRVSIPCFRCRLIRRIANRKANNIVCCLLSNALHEAERQIRCRVELYHR